MSGRVAVGCYNFYYYTMSGSPKKVKKEGFNESRHYQNIPGFTKIIQSYLAPLRADLLSKSDS